MAEVLAESGLATRAFYRHFPSKDHLLVALIRNDGDLVMHEMHSRAAVATSSDEALQLWCRALLHVVTDNRRRHRVSVFASQEAQRARGYWAERARFSAAHQAVLSRILQEGSARGEFPLCRPEPDARSLRAALEAAVEEQVAGSPSVGPDEAAEEVIAFSRRALGWREPRPPPGSVRDL